MRCFEDRRAEYCKNKLLEYGAKEVYIDKANNVIFPMNCEGSDKITVFVAHTDTVFPDLELCGIWMMESIYILQVLVTILRAWEFKRDKTAI